MSEFLRNYMAGVQIMQGRREAARRDQEMQMEQQRQQQLDEQRRAEFMLQLEEHKQRALQNKAAEHQTKLDMAQKSYVLALEKNKLTGMLQGMPRPTAEDMPQPQQETLMAEFGGRPNEITVPQPFQSIPDPIEGRPDVQMPIPTGRQQQEMARAEQQKKMREALMMRQFTQKTPEEIGAESYARARGERMGNPPQPRAEPQGSWQEGTGPDGKPILYNAATGESKPYPAGVTPKSGTDKPPTSVQSRALKFWERGSDALKNIERPVSKDPNSPTLEQAIAKTGTAAQFWMGYAHNSLLTPEQRRYIQAAKSFTEARLRQDSGAAIPPYEYKNDLEMFFIQPGDDPASIEQKRQSRLSVLNALKGEAGRAYTQNYGDIGNGNNPSSPSRPGVTINGVLVEEE